MRLGSLFSGYGGLDHGVSAVLDTDLAWTCDNDPTATRILAHRYPDVPNLGDITAVDWAAVEPVDIITGGFPCQDVSHAGKRAGLHGHTRTGLWSHMAAAIETLRPALVVAENVRGLLNASATSNLEPCPWCVGDDVRGALRALGAVLGTLADIGYDVRWYGLRAADVGAPHGRFRVFVIARPTDTDRATGGQRWEPAPGQAKGGWPRADAGGRDRAPAADAYDPTDDGQRSRQESRRRGDTRARAESGNRSGTDWGDYAPAIARWEHTLGRPAPASTEPGRNGQPRLSPTFVEWMMGLPAGWVTDVPGLSRNDQLKALGNGVVPRQAEAALRVLLGGEAAMPSFAASGLLPTPLVLLPTPCAADTGPGQTREARESRGHGDYLEDLPRLLLPTPTATLQSGRCRHGFGPQDLLHALTCDGSRMAGGGAA